MINSELLRKTIEDKGVKYKAIAAALDVSYYGLYKKINNITEFKASEIKKIADFLNMSSEEKEQIFFDNFVE